MTDSHQQQTPPAWYPDPDPSNPGGQRWWDGVRWAEPPRPAVPTAQPLYDGGPDARPAAAPQPGSAQPGPTHSGSTQPGSTQSGQAQSAAGQPGAFSAGYGQPGYGQPGYGQAGYGPGYPQVAAQQGAVGYPPVAPGTSALTWSVWLVVGLQLLSVIGYLFLDFSSYVRAVLVLSASGSAPEGPDVSRFTSALSGFVVGVLLLDVLALVIYGLTVMFAYFDWRELQRRGFAHPFHWAWTFLGPIVYVIGRTVVARRRGGRDVMWPIWALVAVTVIAIVLVVIKVVTILSAVSSTIGGYVPGVS